MMGKLASAFNMVDISPLAFYIALKITCDQTKKIIELSQPGYSEKLLDKHIMVKAKTIKTLIQKTSLQPYNKLVSSNKKIKYVAKIGSIMYVIVETQVDIAFSTLMVSFLAKNPGSNHFNAINQIMGYLSNSLAKNVTFEGKSKFKPF